MRTCVVAVALLALLAMKADAAEVGSPRDIVQGIYEDVFNAHDVASLDRYLTEDFIDHNPDSGQEPGRAGVKTALAKMFVAFPDLHVTPEQILVDGNFVVARSMLTGTQEGEFMGMPASHKAFRVMLIDIVDVQDGVATQRWGLLDSAALMEQLSSAPENAEP